MSGTYFAGYGLSFAAGGERILRDISLEAEAGEFIALLGPNGSGKSTLLRALAGILKPDDGLVKFRGSDFLRMSPRERARWVNYVGGGLRAEFPVTAYEAVLTGRAAHGEGWLQRESEDDRARVREAMERALCWGLRDRELPELSGGERQLVTVARAFAQGPKVLLLDEALSQMDLNHQLQIGRRLQDFARSGGVVILVSHDLNLATEWASRTILLARGEKIADGKTEDVINPAFLQRLYPGAELAVAPSPASGKPKVYFSAPRKLC